MKRAIIHFIKRYDRLYSLAVNIKTGKWANDFLSRHDRLYVIAKCVTHLNDPKYIGLLKGYYEKSHEYVTLLIEPRGEKYPDKIIYDVRYGIPKKEKNMERENVGFCALLRLTLLRWIFPDSLGMTPAVEWGRASCYYDSGMDAVTKNVFEYYFEPVAQIPHKEVAECRHVIEETNLSSSYFFLERTADMFGAYHIEQDELEKLGYLYRKYIHLNQSTREYIDENMSNILAGGGILAVHIRGTDFIWGAKNHPKMITFGEYLAKVKEVFGYEKVFLATDDEHALELFKEEFKEKLLYYEDAFRGTTRVGVQCSENDRPLHHYKLGLEILRDVYTLANCDSLVCGLSQVSIAAQYVNVALERRFKELIILDKGINTMSSKEMRYFNDAIRDEYPVG